MNNLQNNIIKNNYNSLLKSIAEEHNGHVSSEVPELLIKSITTACELTVDEQLILHRAVGFAVDNWFDYSQDITAIIAGVDNIIDEYGNEEATSLKAKLKML